MKIISFLGFAKYQETTYVHPDGNKKYTTPFFQEALVKFYQPETLYILLTNKAATEPPRGEKEPNWESLRKRLEGQVNISPIYDIPERNSPEDIWQIFQKVTACLEDGDSVIFDINQGDLPCLTASLP